MINFYKTNQGPFVDQSGNKNRIADLLQFAGIGFDYKRPTLVVHRERTQILYPDFTLHYSGLIVEYYAHPERPRVNEWINRRLQLYQDNHLDVLPVFPPLFVEGWQEQLLEGIERKLENRLQEYRSSPSREGEKRGPSWDIGLLVDCPYHRPTPDYQSSTGIE